MRHLNIFIVDDHAGFRGLIRELLGSDADTHGHGRLHFSEYGSCEAAMHGIGRVTPDLLTVDLNMGGLDGAACVRRLRLAAPAAVLVVVTHLCDAVVAEASRRAGADLVLAKEDLATNPELIRQGLLAAGGP